jgi:hypothetical protein
MATVIKLKRGTTTPTTSDIVNGEVAIDTSAQKLYINDSGSVKEIGGGSSSNSFTTIAVSGQSNVIADSSTDTLTLSNSGLIAITTNATTDTVTIGTPNSAAIPFLKADGSSSNIELQSSGGTISEVITNLYIPFTTSNGTAVETLVVGTA